tara:strand:- start:105 stop:1196 length:1092 start_codon:yes stop_codon:yes gene_type:complete
MKSKVDYDVLDKFTDYDELYLEFERVTNDIRNVDIDYGIDIIFKYYRKYGFPHYTIREEEKHQHMKKLTRFDHNSILDGDKIIQTMHCLRLAWSYFPHFWDVQCGHAKMTPWEIFHDDDKFKSTIKKTWNWSAKHFKGEENQENNKFTENRLRQSLKIYSGTQSVSNFRPTAAKVIYETYGGDGVTWDMSCGWGGRLLGALSSNRIKKYIGTEPASKTFSGLKKIQKDFDYMDTKVELHKLGSEVFRPKEKVDLCFTSPPYFDTEKYSDEETQSYVKYPEEQKWIDGFLFKTIENCYQSLKKNGYLLLNIANTSSGKNIEKATLNISKGFGLVHEKTLQLTLSSVMGAGYKYEPIYVFKKVEE